LRSNITDWSDQQLWKAYIQLTQAEATFRIQKDQLNLRPIWHQREDRVQAHILVCFLAFVQWKSLEMWQQRAGLGRGASQETAPPTALNALTLGAQAENPHVKVRLAWTGSWFDRNQERKEAKNLIALGCNVLSSDYGSTAVNENAGAEGLWNTGSASDMRPFAPGTCLLSFIDDRRSYYIAQVGATLNGRWRAGMSGGASPAR
jgi:hypothetical protein